MDIATFLIIFGSKYLIALPVIVLVVYWFLENRDTRIKLLWLVAISLPLVYLFARLAGFFYSHTQPFATLAFEPLVSHVVDNSFPSDHVALAGSVAMVTFYNNRLLGLFFWVCAGLIGLSRMFAGLHWGVDVIASAIIAIAVVVIVEKIVKRFLAL